MTYRMSQGVSLDAIASRVTLVTSARARRPCQGNTNTSGCPIFFRAGRMDAMLLRSWHLR